MPSAIEYPYTRAPFELAFPWPLDHRCPAFATPVPGRIAQRAPDAWTGLTDLAEVAVAPDGALYALEMAAGNSEDDFLRASTGRVVLQAATGSPIAIATGLDLPIAMGFGPDGALHVATPASGADDGQGAILSLEVTPERKSVSDATSLATPACPTAAV